MEDCGFRAHGVDGLNAEWGRPPDSITADCDHEVCDHEILYEWDDGKWICPDCMKENIQEAVEKWPLTEIAEKFGCEWMPVVVPARRCGI